MKTKFDWSKFLSIIESISRFVTHFKFTTFSRTWLTISLKNTKCQMKKFLTSFSTRWSDYVYKTKILFRITLIIIWYSNKTSLKLMKYLTTFKWYSKFYANYSLDTTNSSINTILSNSRAKITRSSSFEMSSTNYSSMNSSFKRERNRKKTTKATILNKTISRKKSSALINSATNLNILKKNIEWKKNINSRQTIKTSTKKTMTKKMMTRKITTKKMIFSKSKIDVKWSQWSTTSTIFICVNFYSTSIIKSILTTILFLKNSFSRISIVTWRIANSVIIHIMIFHIIWNKFVQFRNHVFNKLFTSSIMRRKFFTKFWNTISYHLSVSIFFFNFNDF